MSDVYPRSFSHIGISVPDLERAVTFYTEVMGWYLIMEPTEIEKDDSAIGEMCTDVFGAGWESFRIAHLSTGDRIGVEIFQFKNQTNPEDNFEYWKPEFFTSVCKTQASRNLRIALWPLVVKSAWRSRATTIRARSLTA